MSYTRAILAAITLLLFSVHSQADGYTYYHFAGKMGDKVQVEIAFQESDDFDDYPVAGYIYYPKASHPAPILIVGRRMADNWFSFNEYQPDGSITGMLSMKLDCFDCADGPVVKEGEWTNPKTDAKFSLTTLRSPDDFDSTQMYMPDWYEDPLVVADPAHIAKEYSYKTWHIGMKDWMGGSVVFRAAGKNKLHFNISNVPSNIAEGKSAAGRPAVLDGSEFTYERVNDCGYGFRCMIFEKFLVIDSTTGPDTFDCFGAHTTLAGVYIKTGD